MTTTLADLQSETVAVEPPLVYRCEACEARLEPVEFDDGGRWTVRGLVSHGRRRHKAVLCWSCFVAASRLLRGGADAEPVSNETDVQEEQEEMALEPVSNETADAAAYLRPGWPERRSDKPTSRPELPRAERICPVCARPQRRLFDTADGPACAACMRYSGAARLAPAPWRVNLTRGQVRREWPGRPPAGAEGAEKGKRQQPGGKRG
jgi:hypothetical protein